MGTTRREFDGVNRGDTGIDSGHQEPVPLASGEAALVPVGRQEFLEDSII